MSEVALVGSLFHDGESGRFVHTDPHLCELAGEKPSEKGADTDIREEIAAPSYSRPAGAVVTKDVPAYALIVGNPGRQAGWMSEYGQKLQFDADGNAICSESGVAYQLKDNQVSRR